MKQSTRFAPVDMSSEEFRQVGHQLVDQIADFLTSLPDRPVRPSQSPRAIRQVLGSESLPENGRPAAELIQRAMDLLFEHSTFNGHPRFMGYITSSATLIGTLGDLLAATVNPNLGAFQLSPMATEIEAQTMRWIAELIGYPADSGGLLVSGGNAANFVGFLAARKAKAVWNVRQKGLLDSSGRQLFVYVSQETHTWVEKAADLFGLGTDAIRWIPADDQQRMDPVALQKHIDDDLTQGGQPFLVVGTAGTVSTGAIDPLPQIAAICRQYDLWFHVDGAYGAFSAALPDTPADIRSIAEADSVALDPHKWLYSPLEAGCTLVRNPQSLLNAFSYNPDYYHFEEDVAEATIDYYEYGLQNSRGFRALKVWLGLLQAGKDGYVRMMQDDVALAGALYELAGRHPELETYTHNLSITTFRYVPAGLITGDEAVETYLNELNTELLERLQLSGEAFISNAMLDGAFVLRACIVNFRTTMVDIEALPEIVVQIGRQVDQEIRPEHLQ